jgi:hypothetical protein
MQNAQIERQKVEQKNASNLPLQVKFLVHKLVKGMA